MQTKRGGAAALMSLAALAALATPGLAQSGAPLPIADFEGLDYGAWKATGTAFGAGPAHGALPGQMPVNGFRGRGLVNSYLGGDDATGTLTSPAFRIQRKFITFLIGGGAWARETCMNLVVDGNIVRTATGPNTEPGGSEALEPAAWDVTEFAGREAVLVIVDERKGGWGHINVDEIMQTDNRDEIPLAGAPKQELTREIAVNADYLQLPLVNRKDGKRPDLEELRVEAGGKLLRRMHVEFPAPGRQPDYWYSVNLREFKGRTVTLRYHSRNPEALQQLTLSDTEILAPNAYATPYRPRFHFSPRVGWMNDINGSYYQNGLYHIFYQYNPSSSNGGAGFDMHWGHSTSRDLVHWDAWPVALFPNAAGQCYSGTSVMQQKPIPGLNEGVKLPAPVLFFAATEPFSQHIATSPDGGKSWVRYAGNPVVPNQGDDDRDPKVFWHAASQHYVMVLYVGGPDSYRIFRSTDLIHWEQTCVLPNWFECPEFIPVKSAVTGEDLMLLYGSYHTPSGAAEPVNFRSAYQLGRFDGKVFTPVTKVREAHLGPSFYAALVFTNAPRKRLTMMGWAAGTRFPGEEFNQCATVPLELQLKAIGGSDALCFQPAPELNALRGKPLVKLSHVTVAEANARLQGLSREDPLDVVVRFRPSESRSVAVKIRAIAFTYDPAAKQVRMGDRMRALHPGATLEARFLIDRGIVESFWNGGEAAYTIGSLHTDDGPAFGLEGDAVIDELVVYPMADIWK